MDNQETIERIRNISILQSMGERPDRAILIKCPCPDHSDSTPSFWVKPDNFFKCFGCGVYGFNFIDFCRKVLGEDYQDIIAEYK